MLPCKIVLVWELLFQLCFFFLHCAILICGGGGGVIPCIKITMKELPLLFVKKIVKSSRVNDSNNRFKTLIHKAEVDLIYHLFNIQKEKCHPDFFFSQTMLFTCLGFFFFTHQVGWVTSGQLPCRLILNSC